MNRRTFLSAVSAVASAALLPLRAIGAVPKHGDIVTGGVVAETRTAALPILSGRLYIWNGHKWEYFVIENVMSQFGRGPHYPDKLGHRIEILDDDKECFAWERSGPGERAKFIGRYPRPKA